MVQRNFSVFDHINLVAVVQSKDGGIRLPLRNSLQTIQIIKIQLPVAQTGNRNQVPNNHHNQQQKV